MLFISYGIIENNIIAYEGGRQMRKKLISLVLAVSMILGLTACGGNSPCTITIEGKKYDLSDDFQDVVSEMVKNDISVVAMMRMMA